MELMEDGNLMDKVNILIQRDMEYYIKNQTILQETICIGIVGGRLDFPRSASFAAVKLVLWWEEEFVAAYRQSSGFLQQTNVAVADDSSGGCGGIVKASDPAKFIALINKSSDQFLEHLHVLTQEALDHADLAVLTGTIGAAALLKNCLWCYLQTANSKQSECDELQKSQKKYNEMQEALAERLLDLHCRLLSLYILQDAESLNWESSKVFCESERASYVIQMWWLYMQGTMEDLWNTVPPKMAQRVFSGMLNETLTILTVRYAQALPSQQRSTLHTVDISNLLLCITQLLPAICSNADEFIGLNLNIQSKMLRDIHSKCNELLTCLLLRGSSLDILYKVIKKGLDKIDIFKPKLNAASAWIQFTMPEMLNINVFLELTVVMSQPQPNWALFLKVLCMENCRIISIILNVFLSKYVELNEPIQIRKTKDSKCNGFLCSGDGSCKSIDTECLFLSPEHYYDLIYSATYVLLIIGNENDFQNFLIRSITKHDNWFNCFDRRQVWNQKRPAWYEAIMHLTKPVIKSLSESIIEAVKTGASMYQVCSIVLATFMQVWECINPSLFIITSQLEEILPSNVTPMGQSVLIQILISILYSDLLNKSNETKVTFAQNIKVENEDITQNSDEFIALAITEALCSIDEDNKHTDEIQGFLEHAKMCTQDYQIKTEGCKRVEDNLQVLQTLASNVLMSDEGKRSLKILHHFVKNNDKWLMGKLKNDNVDPVPRIANKKCDDLLHTMFYIGDESFDQLLMGTWKPNWLEIFNIPMSLTVEHTNAQILTRWEFRDETFLETQYGFMVGEINNILKQTHN